jgi:ABC-type multidrug transport system fused ATPase/permease subunit
MPAAPETHPAAAEAGGPQKTTPPRRPALKLLRRLRPYTRPYRKYVALIFAGLLLGLPLAWLNPLLVKAVFDDAVANRNVPLLWKLGGLFALVALVEAWIAFGRGVATTLLHHKMTHRLRLDLFRGFQKLRFGEVQKKGAGEWKSRLVDDAQNLGGVTGDFFAQGVAAVVSLIVATTILFIVAPKLAGTCLVGALVLFGLQALVAPRLRERSRRVTEGVERTSESLHQSVSGVAAVRSSAAEGREARRYASFMAETWRASLKRDLFGLWSGHPSVLLGGLFPAFVLILGASEIAQGSMTTGGLFAAYGLIGQVFTAVHRLTSMNPTLQASLAAVERLVDFLDLAAAAPQPSGTFAPAALRGDVVFENVTFGYGPPDAADAKAVLNSVSFSAPAGTTVALVGRSGAGKSTLVSLLSRLHEPWSGRILLDGVPLKDYDVRALRARMGVVAQDVFVFNRTARENLAFGRPDATEAQIVAAAEAADAHEFIKELNEGYDTKLGERGVRLSGGQRQRLAIARELLRDPRLVILDEATAWLDAESEARVQTAVERLLRGRTAFVIAHRLATVRRADLILVLDEGRVVDRGTHAELVLRGGLYADLAARQFVDGARERPAAP